MSRKAHRTAVVRRAIVLMVALAVPLATIPRAPACECAPSGSEVASECACCAPAASVAPPSCCSSRAESTTCCNPENSEECDCPKCQGEVIPSVKAIAHGERLVLSGSSTNFVLALADQTPRDTWLFARMSERPPPPVYLTRHGPQLERLCRWLI